MPEPKIKRRKPVPRLPSKAYAWDGAALDRIARAAAVTDEAMAAWTGASLKSVYNWRTNRAEPAGSVVRSLGDLLSVDPAVFYREVPL